MNLVELDIELQGRGWCRVNMSTWSSPPRLITRLDGKPVDSWELKTITGVSLITREYFPDEQSVFEAASRRCDGASCEMGSPE